MLSGKKNYIFRPIVDAAWLKHCEHNSGAKPNDKKAKDRWYRQELVTTLGIYTTKEIPDHDEDMFDDLCAHFATLSEDESQIEYWSRAKERRALHRLEITMRNAGVNWNYVLGIARNMGLIRVDDSEITIKDLPAELILKINAAVYIYMKRKQTPEVQPCLL